MSSSLPEFSNRIINIGTLVLFGMLPAYEAFERIRQDQELTNLSDDQLLDLIEETNRYWREIMNVSSPESFVIYPELMITCIKTRLKRLGQLTEGASDEDKPAVNLRRAHGFTILAQSLLAEGMIFLLIPDPQMAWKLLAEAKLTARALPDFGQLRLREVMWACYGQAIAAQLGGQSDLLLQAQEELARLQQIPNREQEAQAYLEEIQHEFDMFRNVFQQRQKALASARDSSSAAPKSYAVYYKDQLNHYGELILSGKMQPVEAKKELLAHIDLSLVEISIYSLSNFHFGVAKIMPDRAIVLADLNYAAACLLTSNLAELTRAYCAYALGNAYTVRAMQIRIYAESFRQAIPYLEEALPVIEKGSDPTSVDVQHIMTLLSVCYRRTGNFEKARELNCQLIERLAERTDFHSRINLGSAYGNLSDLQANIMGDQAAAFESLYKAFRIFFEVKDLLLVRETLDYMAEVSIRIGRLDDTMAAWEETAALMVEFADLKGAVKTYFLLARYAFQLWYVERGLRFLLRAENLIQPQVSKEHPDREFLLLYHELLIWQGYVFTLLVSMPSELYTFKEAYEPLELSRQVAVELQDHDRLARSILQLARLFDQVGNFDRAEMYCDMIDYVPCLPVNTALRDEILGKVRVHQGRYEEAIVSLQKVIAACTTDDIYVPRNRDRKWVVLHLIGQAYEGIGDIEEAVRSYESALDIIEQSRLELYEESRMGFAKNVVEIYNRLITLYARRNIAVYNPVRALFWLEKSKSRTFVEMMGLSNLPLREASTDIHAALTEERQLLRELNMIRRRLFISHQAQTDPLDLQQRMRTYLERLKSIWNQLTAQYPEYVEMRQGKVVDWSEVQKMLEKES